MKNNHVQQIIAEGVKVKDYTPTFKMIEVIEDCFPFGRPIGIMSLCKVKEKYGERKLLSVMDFHDTKTTSYIIGGEHDS